MTFEQFIEKWTGKPVDFDGVYPNQCFDLAHQYIYDVLRIKDPRIISHPSAYQIFANFNQNGIDAKHFTKIANTPLGVPNKGDLVVWGQGAGTHGHVAIFIEGNANRFTSFDANWPVGSLPHIQGHYYNNVICWLRKKGGSMPNDALDACMKDREKFWKERDEAREDLKRETEASKTRVKAEEDKYQQLEDQTNAFKVSLAQSLNTAPDEPKILEQITTLMSVEDENTKKDREIDQLKKQLDDAIKNGSVTIKDAKHSRLCAWLADRGW